MRPIIEKLDLKRVLNKLAAIDEDTGVPHGRRRHQNGDHCHHQAGREEAAINGSESAVKILRPKVAFRAGFDSTVMFPFLSSHAAISKFLRTAQSVS